MSVTTIERPGAEPPAPPDSGDDDFGGWESDPYQRFRPCSNCEHSYSHHYVTGRPGCEIGYCKCPDWA